VTEKEISTAEKSDINLFTNEIEDTIDDLFTPEKQIEIDPLTQEIKVLADDAEVQEQNAEPGVDTPSVMEKDPVPDIPVEEGSVKEPADTEIEEIEISLAEELPSVEVDEPQEMELEPLEITLEDQKTAADTGTNRPETENSSRQTADEELLIEEMSLETGQQEDDVSPGDKTTGTPPDSGLSDMLNRLKQNILTIEWEVTSEQLQQTIEITNTIRENAKGMDPRIQTLLLPAMVAALKAMKEKPGAMPATTPALMKRAVDLMEKAVGTSETAGVKQEGVEKVAAALKEAVASVQQETGRKQTIQETTITKQADQGRKDGGIPGDNSWKEDACRTVSQHLEALEQTIARILPVEKVLGAQPEASKLYLFQRSIRLSLQEEYDRLSQFFLGKTKEWEEPGPIAPAATSGTDKPQEERMPSADLPFNRLMICTVDGMKIGLIPEQVALISKPGPFTKGKVRKADSIKLGSLRKWPWSKLMPETSGELSQKSEKELASLELPVLRTIGENTVEAEKDFVAVVLIHEGKGFVLLTADNPIEEQFSKEEWQWKPESSGYLKGILDSETETVHLLDCRNG